MDKLDRQNANALRVLSMDAVQRANSGHPGMPMGMADVAYVLWTRYLKHNPKDSRWPNRDRFVLSAGHGSMLLYSLLYLTGYPLSLEDLKDFRQWGSETPGHPEYEPELGIETTTGPLGQGFAVGVGMAIAGKHLAARFNRPEFPIFDNTVYAIVSDGDLMEGISHEAASMAGHLGLDNLIYFYDDNEISIAGSTDLAFTEDVPMRFRAYGWHVQEVDGHDMEAIAAAIEEAQEVQGRPHLIVAHTHIAFGSPNKQDSEKAHGAPLGVEEVEASKENLGWPSQEPFYVPDEIVDHYREAIGEGERAEAEWRSMLARYEDEYPELAADLELFLDGQLPAGWEEVIPHFTEDQGPLATRAASGETLRALAKVIPQLMGGSADLEPSNKTYLPGMGDFQQGNYEGRNVRFGVREHAMGAILNGMAQYDGLRAYGGTFLVFSDYMRPPVRLAAMMGLPIVYVWTHDSIYLGEDGPTHQPIEHLAALRAIPNLTVIRPADANETAAAWKVAMEIDDGPVALALSRQKLPIVTHPEAALEGVARGGYVLRESPLDRIDVIILATGSEIADALAAQLRLQQEGVGARVVSMPSWSLFEAQPEEYRAEVLPDEVTHRISVEAGGRLGWRRYVGEKGVVMGIDHFGASAPYKKLQQAFELSPEDIAKRALALIKGG